MQRAKEGLSQKTSSSITELIERLVLANYPEDQIELVKKAYSFAEKAHEGQMRKSGEPYITHPVGVASILAELNLDISTIITGLLHDTVEDTSVTLEDVEELFGNTVMELVDGATKISKIKFRNTHEKQGENIRKMIVAMGRDVRVILVKLADRLHNMRTLGSMPIIKQARISRETLDIYAPLASRLGMSSIKVELENLGFRHSVPDMYHSLVNKINKKKEDRQSYIEKVKGILSEQFSKSVKFDFEIQGRPKDLYSIYKKMNLRNIDYDQVYDLLAFRICVNTIPQCYEVLGIVHSLWRPIPGRFKDFIAMAKTNNYQSLHTTVIGPQAERIEIQIRTQEMHEIAEWGIAAHWRYKDKNHKRPQTNENTLEKFNWLRELVSLHQQIHSSDELLESFKTDLIESDIYVFTPNGEVKEFPKGATPIDFAYSVHTDVGNQTVAARVNGRMVPLKYRLQNGDTIEIITSKKQKPSKDWLKFCITIRAKSRIRSLIKKEQREGALNLGKEILEKGLRKYKVSLQRLADQEAYNDYLKKQGLNSLNDLFVNIGYGKVTPVKVLEVVMPEVLGTEVVEESESNTIEKAFRSAAKKSKNRDLISVGGLNDMLVRFAKCCSPIPGDSILGFITRGRGATIHRTDCERAFELDQERRIDVEWNNSKHSSENYVHIRVVSHDVLGLLIKMSEAFSSLGVNIISAKIRTTRDKKAISIFNAAVRDTQHLEEVLNHLLKIKGTLSATRI